MASLKIDSQKIDDSFGLLTQGANSGIVEVLEQAAQAILPLQGSNALADELIENCKKVQDNYNNGFLPGLNATIEEFKKVIDIGEYLAKIATVGDVKNEDTGVAVDQIDADAVMM